MVRSFAIIAGCLVSGSALAAEPVSQFVLNVTSAEVSEIGTALSARPYSEVAALMGKLQTQIDQQSKAAEKSAPPPPAQPDAQK